MTIPKTIGFPRMQKEPGERRVFLPDFIQYLAQLGASIQLEEGIGSRSGFTFDDYRQGNHAVHHCSRAEAFQQDLVLILRAPSREEMKQIKPGSTLISMLHYPTRPGRVAFLQESGIQAISLDSIEDDYNRRLVENMKAVAWNGLEAAFDVLEKTLGGDLRRMDDKPIHVLVLGSGMVGRHAVDAATKLGNIERNQAHMQVGGIGVLVTTAGRNISQNADIMQELLASTDILVDATQRRDTSQPVVPNSWIAHLPAHAVIADLSVDPYLLDSQPPVERGVEGIPQGNLDQYIFLPDDSAWDKTVPAAVPSIHRRAVVSCYSWPGIHPEACMTHYAHQLEPLMEVLLHKSFADISLEGDYFERALYRARLDTFLKSTAAV